MAGPRAGSAAGDDGSLAGWSLEIESGFSNDDGITVSDGNCLTSVQGQATPYPSGILVSGLSGMVTDVNVTLKGVTHQRPAELRVLLVGPGGQTVQLLSEALGSSSFPLSNVTFKLDDQAPGPITLPITPGGSYQPTVDTTDACALVTELTDVPASAPAGPYGSALSDLDGTDPNGTWQLYVVDVSDTNIGGGSLAGWSLEITTGPAPVASYEDQVLADGPIGYWRLGEASGTVANDSSGNGHHGAYFNGAVLGQLGAILGDSDTAALFDGVNDELRVPHAPGLNVGSTFTAEAWIKRSAVTQSHSIVSKGANGLQLVVMNVANANQVWLRKTGVTTIATSSTGVPADGEYHHVAATMDGAGSARISIDGVDVTVAAPNQHLQVIGNTTLPLRFAGAAGSVAAAYDELALYASALSPATIAARFAAGQTP